MHNYFLLYKEEKIEITSGSDSYFINSHSPDNSWIAIFEDDGETGYLYLCSTKKNGEFDNIVDHLWIYNQIDPPIKECKDVFIIWLDDSKRCGLIVDGECWGIFDLKSRRKINAPRIENRIVSLNMDIWDNGIGINEGESLRIRRE